MIQRLAVAHLVVADHSNVYYEVGVGHPAREMGCVLVARGLGAPSVRPLADAASAIPAARRNVNTNTKKKAVAAATGAPRNDLPALVNGTSPVFDAVPGFSVCDEQRLTAFADTVSELQQFDADVKAVWATPRKQRGDRVRAPVAKTTRGQRCAKSWPSSSSG